VLLLNLIIVAYLVRQLRRGRGREATSISYHS
jgi:uncharacterized membrane protein (DUF2068 family)